MIRLPARRASARLFSGTLASVVLSSAAALAVASLTGCSYDPAPFSPNSFTKLARARAAENPTQEMRPLPTRLESPYLSSTQPSTRPVFGPATQPAPGPRPIRRMALRDIVRTAVAHNADVHVNAYQPAIDTARIVEAEAAYDLRYYTSFQFSNQNDLFPSSVNPALSPVAGRNTVVLQDMQIQTGFKQETATGGTVDLSAKTDQFFRSGPGTRVNGVTVPGYKPNPFWVNEVTLQVKQPLLQNFGSAANAARIAVARNTAKSSMLDFRLNLEKNLAETEKAYWQLVQAEQTVKIRETLLEQTTGTADLLHKRVGTQGTTNTEVSQANAAVEARRADLIRSRAQVEDLSDVLKNKMNDPDFPVSTADLILPADLPIDTPIRFDAAEQIQTALTYRAELSQQQVKIQSAEITIGAAKNNELPKLDATASLGLLGVGKDWTRALKDQGRFDYTDYTLGLQLEIPIGNREARSIRVRTELQRLQAIEQYRVIVDQVTMEVKQAQREVETTWNEMIQSRQARIAAEDELRRLDIDQGARPDAMSPGFINAKLDAQLRLSDQAQREVTAIANYNIAISALERSKGTLLRYDNIVLEEDPKVTYNPRTVR